MKIIKLSRALLLNDIREFNGFFWPFVFPLILFFILTSVFSGAYSDGGVTFKLGVVKEVELSGFGKILDQVLGSISPDPFQITYFEDLEEARKNLQTKKIDLILKIPKDFNMALARVMLFSQGVANLEFYARANSVESEMAKRILQSILGTIDLEISKQKIARSGGNYTQVNFELIPVQKQTQNEKFHYPTYIFPAVILMSVLSLGFFNLPLGLIYNRESGINKRLYSTPVRSLEYLSSFGLSVFFSMVLSSVIIYAMGLAIYKVSNLVLSAGFILKLLFSIVVSFSIGITVVSVCRRFSTAIVTVQILYQLMMFLGGFYFPVLNLNMPVFIRAIAYVLPTTYLAENLRYSLHQGVYTFSQFQLWAVPLAWVAVSIVAFAFSFKKVMGYE
ncbi:ABC transporter permease [Pseudothermotoga sp. U03pept]|uniref:ABC transporter permease n=1 Tax=Pseudothermotoga sp. U03pept TaxID=3447012 RepID=UPI003F11E3CD